MSEAEYVCTSCGWASKDPEQFCEVGIRGMFATGRVCSVSCAPVWLREHLMDLPQSPHGA
jgi:hypothetical protein